VPPEVEPTVAPVPLGVPPLAVVPPVVVTAPPFDGSLSSSPELHADMARPLASRPGKSKRRLRVSAELA
jgi:hypothetical protein